MRENKILIVDDNPINVEVMEENLSEEYSLEVAVSGEETLEKIVFFKPEIVLLDIMMPGMNGYEVCRRIRKLPELRFTKIIMVSAKALDSERIEGYDAGADDYMVKPFNRQELQAKIRVYLNLKSEEEMNEIKGDLLLLISHETNTPLNSIKGFAELLLHTDLDEKQKIFVSTIVKSGDSLEKFIKKALLLSGLRGGDMKMAFKLEPLGLMIDESIKRLGDLAKEKNITFSVTEGTGKNIVCQRDLMESAFKAVIENAIKFSPEGELVLIEAGGENGWCTIKVTDHGKGIEADNLENIFDLFSVQDLEHHHSGHGLSLAIARNIMVRHGGSLTAENVSGGGAAFTFSLPIKF
ncbi:hypothetical protein MNBD_UNCLBAC01-1253 [hydrothermal vent metagenome]|uniref:Histidine kinase n=1 Tax=hydrothermal vent metagenome TaxID=652676 RepID=A0A3B1DL57_9ZZZZ